MNAAIPVLATATRDRPAHVANHQARTDIQPMTKALNRFHLSGARMYMKWY
jgi:hypothetical protein